MMINIVLYGHFSSHIPCFRNPQRVSNYKHYFNKLNIQGFDFRKWI